MQQRLQQPLLLSALFCSAFAVATPVTATAPNQEPMEFFEKKVRPLLLEHCLECHSRSPGHKVKGGLSLDSRHDWLKGGDSGPAIVPGDPEQSLLIEAVRWKNLELQMPPKKKLSASDLEILTTWIQNGAFDPRQPIATQSPNSPQSSRKLWSYQPLRKDVQPPSVQNTSWPQSPIDRFILAKMEEKQLSPAADATAEVLVRRLSYTLTGLPPTPPQLEQFRQKASSNRPLAIQQLVDELLASPHFGEHWAKNWLAVARFAESSGGGRTLLFKDAWRYRDYIIECFNADRPFDQMIREQIAGDLLPADDPEQRSRQLCATAFLALGPTIYEEQDKQRLRFDVIDEQLDTIGKAFLGQTISCARCHDHKFDPISQQDYYALAGIFASTRTLSSYTANVASWVTTPLPLPADQEKQYTKAGKRIDKLNDKIKATRKELNNLKKGLSKLAATKGQPVAISDVPGIVVDDTKAKANGYWKPSQFTPHYIGEGYVHDENEGKGLKTLTFTPKLPESGRYQVRLAYPPVENRGIRVPIHIVHSGGRDTVHVDQSKPLEIDERFVLLGTYYFDKNGPCDVIVSTEGSTGFVSIDAVQFISETLVQQLAKEATSNNKPGQPTVAEVEQCLAKLEAEKKSLQAFIDSRPRTMSVREEDRIGDTEVRIRGDVHKKGKMIARGYLSSVSLPLHESHQIPQDQSGRVQLAEWLTHPEHPLTARVYVNRVWGWLFGEGLVRSVDNFGTTGNEPTHPELLDYLTRQFVAQGWGTKTLIRQIINTRTWQLSTGSQEADPDNLWLSHAHRRRLDAEPIRDTILAVSGTLDPQLGGPNITAATSAASDSGAASTLEYNYQYTDTRRSLYTPAFRNNRLELFEVFDFGDINTSQGKRHASTVAPQASFFLNHPFVIEQANLAATRLLASSQTEYTSEDVLLRQAFLQTLGRHPLPGEMQACLNHLEGQQEPSAKQEAWSAIFQSLFGSIDFRYLE